MAPRGERHRVLRALAALAAACSLAGPALALTYAEVSVTCPLDGSVTRMVAAASGTQFGVYLDFKPSGALAAPAPLPRCASGFVIYKPKFTQAELEKLRAFVASDAFRKLRRHKSDYYVAAKLQQYMGESPRTVAWTLLEASWEAEERYPQVAAEALGAFARVLSRAKLDPETRVRMELASGELERRLGRFDAARSRFDRIRGDPDFKDGYVAAIIALQLKLIEARDSEPHLVPREFHRLKGPTREELREIESAKRLLRYGERRESFDIKDAVVAQNALLIRARLAEPAVLDYAYWWNPAVKGKPQFDWSTFLRVYDAADGNIGRHAWLAAWKAAAPGRLLEVRMFGDGAMQRDWDLAVDYLLPHLWHEARFSGEPAYHVRGWRGGADPPVSLQVYFSNEDARALVIENMPRHGASPHWLDDAGDPRLDLRFHPRCAPGSRDSRYIVVAPDGKRELREFGACLPQVR